MERPTFAAYSGEEIALRNRLYGRAASLVLAGEPMELRFVPDASPLAPRCDVRLDMEGRAARVVLDAVFFAAAMDQALAGASFAELERELREAVLETVFEEPLTAFEKAFGLNIKLAGAGLDDIPATDGRALAFVLTRPDGGEAARGRLELDAESLNLLSRIMSKLPPEAVERDDVPLTAALEVGRTKLTVSLVRDLAPGDIIILDASVWSGDRKAVLRVAPNLAFSLAVTDEAATVIGFLENGMPTPDAPQTGQSPGQNAEPNAGPLPAPARDMNDVEIELTFDLGTRTMTLGELKSLAPGQAFGLETGFDGPVRIRTGGAVVGKGEIVSIDGTLGVRIVELFGTGR